MKPDPTPQLPPVLPGFSEPIYGDLKVPAEDSDLNDVALLDELGWEVGYYGILPAWYSLRLGSPIALANGIGVVPDLLRPELRKEIEDHIESRKDSIAATRRYFCGEPLPDAPAPEGKYVCGQCGKRTDATLCPVITCNGRTHMPAAPVGEPDEDEPMPYIEGNFRKCGDCYDGMLLKDHGEECESCGRKRLLEAKPEAADDEPIEVWNPLEHGIRNVPLMVPSHLHNKKVSRLERELAAANSEKVTLTEHLKLTREDLKEAQDHFHEFKMDSELELTQANAAVGNLRNALGLAREAIGDHFAPNDCYSTGPLTGDPIRDLVCCPACAFIASYESVNKPTPPAPDGWREIETAPKDGTFVVLLHQSCARDGVLEASVGRWLDNRDGGKEGWWSDCGLEWPSTHWMPLPNPPSGNGGGE